MMQNHPTHIRVTFTKEELLSMGEDADYKILQRLRTAGIPARGTMKFEGVNIGVLRASYNTKEEVRTVDWYFSREFAEADGVELPSQPRTN